MSMDNIKVRPFLARIKEHTAPVSLLQVCVIYVFVCIYLCIYRKDYTVTTALRNSAFDISFYAEFLGHLNLFFFLVFIFLFLC